MNLKNIKSLVKLLDEAGLSVVEVSEGESKIHLERNVVCGPAAAQPVAVPPYSAFAEEALSLAPTAAADNAINFNNVSEFRSPIIGVYYSASGPDVKPFIEVGSRVKKGDVLCIIEAMKVMNEVVSDRDGEIVDICVQNGQVVEYAQVLFKIF